MIGCFGGPNLSEIVEAQERLGMAISTFELDHAKAKAWVEERAVTTPLRFSQAVDELLDRCISGRTPAELKREAT